MSLILFFFVSTLFLFFFANYVLSPKENPHFNRLLEFEHAPPKEVIEIVAGCANAVALLLTMSMIIVIPFARILGSVAMVVFVARFFYKRNLAGVVGEAFNEAVDEVVEEEVERKIPPMEQVAIDTAAGPNVSPFVPDKVHPE